MFDYKNELNAFPCRNTLSNQISFLHLAIKVRYEVLLWDLNVISVYERLSFFKHILLQKLNYLL